ncbi:MAG: hypothetical protein LBB87_02440, partial [Nitrososphaerota archaeon]|nr:hypothetical protein [Nitrososphaerota archaeon]
TLYPFWTAVFYFSYPIGNVYGVQVGVWGDTGEVAYCWETGSLGSSDVPSNGSSDVPSNGSSSSEQSKSFGDLLSRAIVALIVGLIVIVAVMVVVVFVKKNRK